MIVQGLYFLTEDDFELSNSHEGKTLSLKSMNNGLYLVLFYSSECVFCDELIKIFKRLPETIFGCKYGMVNLNQNSKIVSLANESISPITYVPELILYFNQQPYLKYEGENDINQIREFVLEVSTKLEKASFISEEKPMKEETQKNQNNIMGKPLKGHKKKKNVCYIKQNTAAV